MMTTEEDNLKKLKKQKVLRKKFIETIYETLDNVVSPTPYMSINYGDNFDVKILNGKGRLPRKNTTEITTLDLDIASMFFDDFHPLYAGMTGVGKTYTGDALFNAVYGPDGHITIRLGSGNSLIGNDPTEPWRYEVKFDDERYGKINPAKLTQYGAVFLDEINRGDKDKTFQIMDGKIIENGKTHRLRIPMMKDPKCDTPRYKGLNIIAAMNPADGLHNEATEMDIAGENRFLKFNFPNGLSESASEQYGKKIPENIYEIFWSKFNGNKKFKKNWKDIYPSITDPTQFDVDLRTAQRELIDVSIGYLGYDPQETLDSNHDIISDAGFFPSFTISNNNEYTDIREAQSTLKHGFVRRDLDKICNMSKLISFVKGIKTKTYEIDSDLKNICAAMGVILESKTQTGSEPGKLISLVNDTLFQYNNIHSQMNIPSGFGIRNFIYVSALQACKNDYKKFKGFLNFDMDKLNIPTSNISETLIRSRILSDLAILDHFSQEYEVEFTKALKLSPTNASERISDLYYEKRSDGSPYYRLDPILE